MHVLRCCHGARVRGWYKNLKCLFVTFLHTHFVFLSTWENPGLFLNVYDLRLQADFHILFTWLITFRPWIHLKTHTHKVCYMTLILTIWNPHMQSAVPNRLAGGVSLWHYFQLAWFSTQLFSSGWIRVPTKCMNGCACVLCGRSPYFHFLSACLQG